VAVTVPGAGVIGFVRYRLPSVGSQLLLYASLDRPSRSTADTRRTRGIKSRARGRLPLPVRSDKAGDNVRRPSRRPGRGLGRAECAICLRGASRGRRRSRSASRLDATWAGVEKSPVRSSGRRRSRRLRAPKGWRVLLFDQRRSITARISKAGPRKSSRKHGFDRRTARSSGVPR
jgi:hypothetical protein